jgi:ATP-dependent RNA helicase DDX19/DBP5
MKDDMAKRKFLEDFYYNNSAQAMIFVNTRETAEFLKKLLKNIGRQKGSDLFPKILTGDLSDSDRDLIIDDFRKGYSHALISTNVLARGIDVPEVDIVINYDIPTTSYSQYMEPDYANYLHRVGRTGRF